MDTQWLRRAFSVDEFHRMAEADVFGEEDRLERLDGKIVRMTPLGSCHAGRVNRLNRLAHRRSRKRRSRQRAEPGVAGTNMKVGDLFDCARTGRLPCARNPLCPIGCG